MAKIARKNQKIFGSGASSTQIGVFGSLAAGSAATSTDPDTIQSLSNYLNGWYDAIVGFNSPAIEDANGLDYLWSYQLAYHFQAGIPEWNSATTYYIGSIANDGAGKIYASIQDTNLNHALTNTTWWKVLAYNPLTSLGDLISSDANGVPTRVAVGGNGQSLFANSGASGGVSYLNFPVVKNCGLAASVSSNALTIALKDASGSNPSGSSPVIAPFRNATATTGTFSDVIASSALSIVVPTLATLGQTSAMNQYVWVYLVNDAGTIDIGVCSDLLDDGSLQSCTQISSGAISSSVLYTTSSHSGAKPVRLIGRALVNEATAGTWATTPAELTLNPTPIFKTTPWASSSTTVIGSSSNGTKGTIVVDRHLSRREGRMGKWRLEYKQSTAGSNATGVYLWQTPNAQVIDTSLITLYTGTAGDAVSNIIGTSNAGILSTAGGIGTIFVWDSTHYVLNLNTTASAQINPQANAYWGFGNANLSLAVYAEAPMLGWFDYGP